MNQKLTKYVGSLAVALAALPAAHAQGDDVLGQVVVTAQRRQESIQDVPVSMTAFGEQQLRDLGIDSTLDLAAFTPGLTIGQSSGDGDLLFISLRGVTLRDFASTNESPSSVYLDEFYKANLVGLDQQTFDIRRVEVLRGPQGTLYGRNATGGLIHYITNAPTREFDGYAELTIGDYDRYRAEAALSGPLSTTLSARLSALHHEHDGWIDNVFPGGEDGNALNATSVRGQLLLEPSELSTYSLLVQYSVNDNDAGLMFPHVAARTDPETGLSIPCPGCTGHMGYVEATPNNPRDTNSDRDIFLETDQLTAIGRARWQLDGLELVSITGYEDSSRDGTYDSDGAPFVRGTQGDSEGDQFSQEFRLAGATERVKWLAGAYYFDYDIGGIQSRCTPATCDVQRPPVLFDLQTQSWAVFGSADISLTSTLSLTAGVRYTEEEKEYALNNVEFGFVFDESTVGDLATQDDDNTSYNLRLNWTPQDALLLYAGVATGFKAGAFNVGFTPIATQAIPVRPEELTSYEAGFKSSFINDALRVNGAVFYYDYEDSQAFQYDGRTLAATIFNGDAEVSGAELEIVARPTANFSLLFTGTYLDATLKDIVRPGPAFTGLPPMDMQMPLAPEWDLNLLARYAWPVPWGGRLAVQVSATYNSEQYFDALNSPSHFEPSYSVIDGRVSWYSEDDKWRVSIFADNLTDEVYRTYSFDLAFLNFATDVFAKPRWVGGTVSYRW
jgi:iron complex outermembrane receptor protein